MAKEYQTLPNGNKQWRDLSAGVQGWNNIDRAEGTSSGGSNTAQVNTDPSDAQRKLTNNPIGDDEQRRLNASAGGSRTLSASGKYIIDGGDMWSPNPDYQEPGGAGGGATINSPALGGLQSAMGTGGAATVADDGTQPILSMATPSTSQLRPLGKRNPPPLAGLLHVGMY